MEELYERLGKSKCQELWQKRMSLWQMLELSKEGRKSTQVGGTVLEGIAKDFIREFLPARFGIKSGLVFDTETKKISPQIDGIIYSGVPLLEFTDAVVVEKEQVKAIVEIKSYVYTPTIFGDLKNKETGTRDPNSGLAYAFERRKNYLSSRARYLLFAFELDSASARAEIIERLKKVCESYAIVLRWKSRGESEGGKENLEYNFDNSISELIKWLRNLS